MADRDVKLIIKARNEASKAIDSVAEALGQLKTSQEQVASTAGKTDSALSSLGSELGKLNSKVAGMKALGTVAAQMDRAAAGVEGLKSNVVQAQTNLDKYSAEAASAARRVAELERSEASVSETLKAQRKELSDATRLISQKSAAQRDLTKARKEYAAAQKVPTETSGRDDSIAKAQADLAAATKKVEEYKASQAEAAAKVSETQKRHSELKGELRLARTEYAGLTSSVDKMSVALDRANASLSKGEQEYAKLSAIASDAASSFGMASIEQSKLEASIASALPDIQRMSAALAAMQRYTAGGKVFDPKTAAQMRSVGAESATVLANWKALQGEAARLAAEIRNTAAPTREQYAALQQTVGAARAAKVEYAALRGTLHDLGGTVKGTFAQFVSSTASLESVNSKARAQVEAISASVREQAQAVEKLNSVIARYQTGTGGTADAGTAAQMRRQVQVVSEARARWELLRTEMQKLAAASGGANSALAGNAQRLKLLAASADEAERELRQAEAALAGMGKASTTNIFAGINRESRQAMSIMQRLRGEVYSLATAYIGLYGAISNVGGVIRAYTTLEAAQNRLGAVFKQNEGRTAQELAWIERQAARLGIQFGSLADQYSKFAVAADGANFSGENTRKIFLAVAEAGRVNKLSLDDMNGVFLALQQMLSKGAISSEELRQQLGERLPGALNIMASALGVSTSQLMKMMEQGQVLANESNMLAFADELTKRFGPQLAKSLTTTSALIGKWGDNLFQAQLRVGEGGFIESFNRLLSQMDEWFKSREGRDFFLSLGSALGKVTDIVAFFARNIDVVVSVIGTLIQLKAITWLTGMANGAIAAAMNFKTFAASASGAATATSVASVGTSRMVAALAQAGVAVTAFSASLATAQGRAAIFNGTVAASSGVLTLFTTRLGLARASSVALNAGLGVLAGGARLFGAAITALGGPIGVLIGLATLIAGPMLAEWFTGVDDTTRALDEHKRVMGEILSAYDEAGRKTDAWAKKIKNVSVDQINAEFRRALEAFEKARAEVAGSSFMSNLTPDIANIANSDAWGVINSVNDLRERFREGELTAKQFREELEKLYSNVSYDGGKQFLEGLLDQARAAEAAADEVAVMAEAAKGLGSELPGLDNALAGSSKRVKDLAGASDDGARALGSAAEGAEKFKTSLDGIKELVPELSEEMKKLKELAKLDAAVEGLGMGPFSPDVQALIDQARASINRKYGPSYEQQYTASRGTPEGAQMAELVRATTALAEKMGVSAKDLLTVFSFETGGTLDPWKAGPTTQWGQHRGLIQWGEPQAMQYGVSANSTIQQQVDAIGKYLLDAGVKAGDGLLQIAAAVNAGSASRVNASDAANGGTPGTVTDKVTSQMEDHKAKAEGILAAYAGIYAEAKKISEVEAKAAEDLKAQQVATDKALSDLGFENDLIQKKIEGKTREAFIEEKIRSLQEKDKSLTDNDPRLEQARQLLGTQYDLNQALNEEKISRKDISSIMQPVQALQSQRAALIEQMRILEAQGNTELMQGVNAQIAGVNVQLREAVANALKLLSAMSGPEAEAAKIGLQNIGMSIDNVGEKSSRTRMTVMQMTDQIAGTIEGGLINGFESFAEAIANGENAIKALGQAFQQFAADFLLEIARMILKQLFFNAISAISGGIGQGLGLVTGVAHTGGIAGSSALATRVVSPGWFNNAIRYHSGGIAGLKPGEVPTILKAGEEVLTEDNPRHIANGGGAAPAAKQPKILNFFDAGSFMSEALNTAAGEEAFLNFVRSNPSAFKSALG